MQHAILTIIYHSIESTYQERGVDYFDWLDRQALARRLTKRVELLGYQVELPDLECAA
ncbi:MAG: hypothetical protein AB1609_13655 [Bacillota bacterium]